MWSSQKRLCQVSEIHLRPETSRPAFRNQPRLTPWQVAPAAPLLETTNGPWIRFHLRRRPADLSHFGLPDTSAIHMPTTGRDLGCVSFNISFGFDPELLQAYQSDSSRRNTLEPPARAPPRLRAGGDTGLPQSALDRRIGSRHGCEGSSTL